MKKNQGTLAYIFRDDYRCEINVLKDAKKVVIIDDYVPKIFSPDIDMPAVRIVRRNLPDGPYIHAEPIEEGYYSFGGAFIYSCGSDFRTLNKYPIPLHDRDMTKEPL